ncbi:MAG: transposase [Myxococcota bacterium]
MSELALSSSPIERPIRRRTRRDPQPRFKRDKTDQLDAVEGCPSLQVPADHRARAVQRIVGRLDLSSVEASYSSLGRHGHAPRRVLAVWVYASLIGIHHATKLSRALETDAALRLLSGGHGISRSTLNEFRLRHGALFADCIAQTVAMAQADGLLALDDLAADSMRLRAHASTKAVRTLSRSQRRLVELAAVDPGGLSESERGKHRAKVEKHTCAVAECEARGRTSIVTTNPSAALMKFPDGAGLPGHRISAMAAGVQARFVVAVLVTADTNDYGLLEPIVAETSRVLVRSGVSEDAPLQVAADAGYCARSDLAFAERVRERIDILVDGAEAPAGRSGRFGRDRFTFHPDGSIGCPAGRLMKGPFLQPDGRTKWTGVGCADCALRTNCTPGGIRSLYIDAEFDQLRAAMRARMDAPGGRERYHRRIATVEPVFSNLESTMGFRRASSRHEATVLAEVLLKVLAHNLSRLLGRRKLSRAYCQITPAGLIVPLGNEFLATL